MVLAVGQSPHQIGAFTSKVRLCTKNLSPQQQIMANKSRVIRQNVIRKSETVYSNVELSKFYVTVRVATTWCAGPRGGERQGRQRQLVLLEINFLEYSYCILSLSSISERDPEVINNVGN